MNEQCYSFARDGNGRALLRQAYSFRFAETPDFKQEGEYIATAENPAHCEGFDNISLLTRERFTSGAQARLRCAFTGYGCPEIILVEQPELCEDGVLRYGACFEVVLWKNGINVWRHFMDGQRVCSWHLRLGLAFPVREGEVHELWVRTGEGELTLGVDGISATLRTEDLFPAFYLGVTACEGLVRLYELRTEQGE